MGDVVYFEGVTKLNIDPERVIDQAKGKLTGVIIIGYDEEGEEYFASSWADGGQVLWLLERMKKRLLEAGE